jgi:ankyrin repeat protein
MPVPELPLEILLMIAHNLTNDRGERCFADFNAFTHVNRALYSCLNPLLWRSAMEYSGITARVLTHLIRTNNLARLKYFLELGVNIETGLPSFNSSNRRTFFEMLRDMNRLRTPDNDYLENSPPLVVAASLDNVPLAHLLLENGAQVRYDTLCYSAIHAARSAEMVQLLLDHHADPEQRDLYTLQPLHWYARRDNIAAMRVVLQRGVDVDPLTPFRSIPLHAVRSPEAVTLLLEFGADVRKEDSDANTPLHFAAQRGSTDVVRLLLDHWPDGMMAMNSRVRTPLHVAAEEGMVEVLGMLVERWPDGVRLGDLHHDTPLHLAALSGGIDVVKLLLESWPEGIRKSGHFGNRPLHWAAGEGKTDVVRLLLERWPEGMREKNHHGSTPLHWAAENRRTEVVRLLLEHWPEGTREKDCLSNTPLHLAAREGDIEAMRLLVECWPEGKEVLNRDLMTPMSLFMNYYAQHAVRLGIGIGEEIYALLATEVYEC